MKKWFKRILIAIGVILILIGGAGLYIQVSGIPKYDVQKIDLKVEVTPVRVERGNKIVHMLCINCHFDQKTGGLTGHRLIDVAPAFGTIYSRNITSDPTFGIGKWSDGDIAFFLRTGIKPTDGQYVPPYMVKFPHLADEDLFSIIAFLRSNDSLVRPRQVKDSDCVPSFLVKFLSRVAFKPFEYPKAPIAAPPLADRVSYGKYLATSIVQCYECHSKDFKTNNALIPEKSEGYFGGGNPMLDMLGNTIYTANITMDPKTGIGSWTEDQFTHAIRDGFRPDGRPLHFPMERLPELTNEEIDAVWSYLKSVPVLTHDVERPKTIAVATTATDGEKIYYKYACYACHAKNGVGVCDLTIADAKYRTDDELAAWIRDPSKIQPGSKMPTWQGTIKDEEYQALCSYVRELGKKAQTAKSTASK